MGEVGVLTIFFFESQLIHSSPYIGNLVIHGILKRRSLIVKPLGTVGYVWRIVSFRVG